MIQARTLERKMVTISEAERIIKESKTPGEAVERLHSLPKRQPKPPAPVGGISLSEASRLSGIPEQTISRWVKRGLIPVVLRTNRELYINENVTRILVDAYKKNPGQGKKDISKLGGIYVV